MSRIKRVLIGCEFSGTVRDAFSAAGFDAWSCDLEPTITIGNHIQDDILNVICRGHWDLLIAHPPCTHLCSSGARWFKEKEEQQQQAIELVKELYAAPIKYIAIENPIGVLSTGFMKPTQIIQPWKFGHGEVKATCLWLKNLPKLYPTNVVEGMEARIHKLPPTADRSKLRSLTYTGVASAMAQQWGRILNVAP